MHFGELEKSSNHLSLYETSYETVILSLKDFATQTKIFSRLCESTRTQPLHCREAEKTAYFLCLFTDPFILLQNTQTLDEFLKDRGGQQTFRPGFGETVDEVDEITIPKG